MSAPDGRHRLLPRADRARVALVLGLALAVTVFTATVPLLRDWFDLRVYHGTVATWVHHGGRVYDYRVPGTTYGFTYPPFAAVAMLPMAWVGLRTAIVVCLGLDLVALGVVLCVLAGPRLRRHGWFGTSLVLCALALFEPFRDTVSFGQVNLLLLALVLADAWLLSTGRERWAGAGIGLAAAVKLTPAIFIGLLLLARRWRAAGLATAVAAAATAAAAWVAPAASRFYWTEALWDTSRSAASTTSPTSPCKASWPGWSRATNRVARSGRCSCSWCSASGPCGAVRRCGPETGRRRSP